MKVNSKMKQLLELRKPEDELSPMLGAIADAGFTSIEGCYLLSALSSINTNVSLADFKDRTGYECFINSLHIEDYSSEVILSQALKFVARIFEVWRSANPSNALLAIISADENSVVVKCHMKRNGEEWLSGDIEGFADAIMSIDSTESWTTTQTV